MENQDYPEAVWVPLTPTGLMVSSIAANDIDGIIRTANTVGGALPTDRYPITISNTNVITYQAGAADIAMDQTYQWVPEASGQVNKFYINLCAVMNMTSFTDDQNIWDTTRVTITRVGGTDIVFDRTYPNGTSVGAVEHHLHIISESVLDKSFKIREGNQLDIRVRTTNTKTPTNITSWGLCPFFPQQIPAAAADPIYFASSGIMFYISRDPINE